MIALPDQRRDIAGETVTDDGNSVVDQEETLKVALKFIRIPSFAIAVYDRRRSPDTVSAREQSCEKTKEICPARVFETR